MTVVSAGIVPSVVKGVVVAAPKPVKKGTDSVPEPVADKKAVSASTKQKNALYGKAVARLRETHLEEFRGLLREEYEGAGLTYTEQKTAEQRAAEKVETAKAKAKAAVEALVASWGNDILPGDAPVEEEPADPEAEAV